MIPLEMLSTSAMLVLSALMLLGIEAALKRLGRGAARGAPFDPRPPGRRALPFAPTS